MEMETEMGKALDIVIEMVSVPRVGDGMHER